MLLEPLGDAWAAFSPLSGTTHVLNDSGAAVLEVLAELGPVPPAQVAAVIAAQVELPVPQIASALDATWRDLIDAGLVRLAPDHPGPAGPAGQPGSTA